MTPVAFYTPVKHPYEAAPSGDRELGRVLMAALRGLGCPPSLASRLLTYRRAFDPADAARVERVAALTAARLIARYRRAPLGERPRAWITYQSYYRAPDLIGPSVATALDIPYVLVDTVPVGEEPPHAVPPVGQRRPARGPARRPHLPHEPAGPAPGRRIAGARASTPSGFSTSRPPSTWRASTRARSAGRPVAPQLGERFAEAEGPLILAVAAMREVKKLEPYRMLADALRRLHAGAPTRSWRLAVVGDGPARSEVAAAFSGAAPWPRHVPRVARARGPAHRLSGEPTSSPSPGASTSSISRPPPRASRSSRAPGRARIPWSPPAARS